MRATWQLGSGSIIERYDERKIEHVLIEYEGPQLVTLTDGANRYLGLAVDADDKYVRWMHARLGKLEWEALLHAMLPVRDVFRKPQVWIVDETYDGSRMRGYQVNGQELDDRDLPRPYLYLTSDVRALFAGDLPRVAARVLRLDQGNVVNEIDFEILGELIKRYQRLWTSCASTIDETIPKSELRRRATLRAVATPSASFGVELTSVDPDLFNAIAARVAQLTGASDDESRLTDVFHMLPHARDPYESLLAYLANQGVDLLAAWPGGGAFFGREHAQRIRASIDRSERVTVKPMPVVGHFRGFSSAEGGYFVFRDPRSGDLYSGSIENALLAVAVERAVTVGGDRTWYEVVLAERTAVRPGQDPKKSYELLSFKEISVPEGT
jgi:hypothetical protein